MQVQPYRVQQLYSDRMFIILHFIFLYLLLFLLCKNACIMVCVSHVTKKLQSLNVLEDIKNQHAVFYIRWI